MAVPSFQISELLLPELNAELAKTRKSIERAADQHRAFKPHEKSLTLIDLCNHLATVSALIGTILRVHTIDLGGPTDPRRFVKEKSVNGVLAVFDEIAVSSLSALKATDDLTMHSPWQFTREGNVIFSGTTYSAFRDKGVNHMIHHRAQLGIYLRHLDIPVPALFGPSADER